MPGAVDRIPAPPGERNAREQQFATRLEAWGGVHRAAVATLGMVAVWVGIGGWAAALVAPYLALALGTVVSMRRNPRIISGTPLGGLLLAMDVLTVAALAYAWGTASSPILWMNVPVVLGWTLVTRRVLGQVALTSVLGVTGALLALEQLGLIPTAPALDVASTLGAQGRVYFFFAFAIALGAAYVLVREVVDQLGNHAAEVSRLQAEQELKAKEDELAERLDQSQRMQALGRLAGGVAHDFNNVLMGLSGLAEIAELRLDHDVEGARRCLQELAGQSQRAAKLTTQLLDYARQRPHEPVATDLAAFLTERRPLLEQLVRGRLRLSLRGAPGCWVRIDPAELTRLLVNLCTNAVDAARPEGELRIRLDRDGDSVRLTLKDDGAGIAAEHLPRVYDPFFTTKPPGEAAGLGLSAVFGIVRRSGGHVDIQSELGMGTTVTVTWPAAAAPKPAVAPQRKALPAARTSPPAHSGTHAPVLLVDDDEAVRAVVQAQLEAAGYSVYATGDPSEALEALETRPPESFRMLITDVVMPTVTGPELAREFGRCCPGAPVLFVSGYAEDVLGEDRELGPMLEKPFTRAQFLSAVEGLLAEPRAERA